MYGTRAPAHQVAQFAPAVAQAAHAGDAIAADLWEQAGRLLAESAFASATGLDRRYSWGGRLFAAGGLILDPFHDALRKLDPDAEFVPPAGQAADGALLLAEGLGAMAPPRYLRMFEGADLRP
jgi:N-acetylglucosamine kinase-like BadF-type ATPase